VTVIMMPCFQEKGMVSYKSRAIFHPPSHSTALLIHSLVRQKKTTLHFKQPNPASLPLPPLRTQIKNRHVGHCCTGCGPPSFFKHRRVSCPGRIQANSFSLLPGKLAQSSFL
jgi:hypothetical protein